MPFERIHDGSHLLSNLHTICISCTTAKLRRDSTKPMPKAAAGTPKAIANKAKAKGLQRLRWYCQMCEKQCRDENGFKCHTMSESHLRQMRVYAENPTQASSGFRVLLSHCLPCPFCLVVPVLFVSHTFFETVQVMEKFSQEFEESYLEALSRLHGTKRVPANQVYQELICNKTHIHMNATKWDSLTTFVKYLGKKGICLVDETEKGWFVQWIDREYLLRREELEKARKEEVEEEVRQQRLMAARAAAAAAAATGKGEEKGAEASRELKRGDGESKIVIGVHGDSGGGGIKRARVNVFEREEEDDGLGMIKKKAVGGQGGLEKGGGKKSEMEKLMEQDAARKAAEERARKKEEGGEEGERTEQWLARGIVVKIINKRLGGPVYLEAMLNSQDMASEANLVSMKEPGQP